MQRIALDLEPAPVLVFVDGKSFESVGSDSSVGVELRSDRPHVLFFKKAGYRSEQVVLRSVDLEGRPRLAPERVVVHLAPLAPRGRDLQVELDEPSE